MNLDIDRKLIMLPGPTNVSDRVTNAMIKPLINHRSSSAKLLFEDIKNKAQKIFQTSNEIITLTCSGTGIIIGANDIELDCISIPSTKKVIISSS